MALTLIDKQLFKRNKIKYWKNKNKSERGQRLKPDSSKNKIIKIKKI